MSKQKIGILHPGQMGVVVAATVRNSGHEVYWASEGRGSETSRRAEEASLTDTGSVVRLCETCSAIVSVCPPEFAESLASEVLRHSFRGLYVDLNAISPGRARRIAGLLEKRGATFLDGCIIGMPARTRGQTWIYLSGAAAEAALPLFKGGPLEVEVLGADAGQASALKMCFAANSKGTAALQTAVLGAAEQLGVRSALERQWTRSGPNPERVAASVRQSAPKAWRFGAEMKEIANTFESVGIPGTFPEAAGEIFGRLASFRGEPEPDLPGVLKKLTREK